MRGTEAVLVGIFAVTMAYFGFTAFGADWPLNVAAAVLTLVIFLALVGAFGRGR